MDNGRLAFKQGITTSGILWFILGHGIKMVDIELCWFGNATRWGSVEVLEGHLKHKCNYP
jgi:hypothetical protein